MLYDVCKKSLFIFVVVCLICCKAEANERTWITDNYEGKIILTHEYIIKIQDYDVFDSILWLSADDIVITNSGCIVNLSSGDKVEIESIYRR